VHVPLESSLLCEGDAASELDANPNPISCYEGMARLIMDHKETANNVCIYSLPTSINLHRDVETAETFILMFETKQPEVWNLSICRELLTRLRASICLSYYICIRTNVRPFASPWL